jgi:acyl-CoA thioester hydrolase
VTERFLFDVSLRWSDLDAYGHVNNARFLTLYEEARVAMFFVGARAHGLGSFEEGIVIARHEVDYLKPIDYGTAPTEATEAPRVRIEMWISELRVAAFTVSYEMFDGKVLASRAKSVCVPYNLANSHPRRLSADERAFLTPYLTEPA